MVKAKDKRTLGKVAALVEQVEQRKVPVVPKRATVSEIIDAFAGSDHSRILYVVDDEGRFRGILSLGNMIRHVFFHYHDPSIDSRSLVSMSISETAGDFMQREPVFAMPSDKVEDILQRMIDHNVKEIPILDDERRVVADVTIVDLLKYYKSVKGADL
jgi:CBS domain-containing protein